MTDSRAVLLAAATEEFARHGPKGTRIQAIVQRAGINERMIYHHFGSKDGLYTAVLEAQAHGLVQAWRQIIDTAAGLAHSVLELMQVADLSIVVATPEPTSIADAYAVIKCAAAQPVGGRSARLGLVVNQVRDRMEAQAPGRLRRPVRGPATAGGPHAARGPRRLADAAVAHRGHRTVPQAAGAV